MVKTSIWKKRNLHLNSILKDCEGIKCYDFGTKLGHFGHSGTHCLTAEAQNVAYTWDSGDLKMTFFCFASWALISVKKTTEHFSFLKLSQAFIKKKLPNISNMWPLWPKIRIHRQYRLQFALQNPTKKIQYRRIHRTAQTQ